MVFTRVDNYLKKFSKLESSEDKSKKARGILEIIIPNIKYKVAMKNKALYFYDLSPASKNEIFFKKSEILSKFKSILGNSAPIEINFRKP